MIGDMMRYLYLLILFFLFFAAPGLAQKPSFLAREILRDALTRNISSTSSELRKINRLLQLQNNNFRDLDQDLLSYFVPSQENMPAKLRLENQRMQQELVRRWLELDFYLSQQKDFLQQSITTSEVQGKIDYSRFIPPHLRLIMLGEVHGQPWILQEVQSVVKYIQKAYPDRHIYYASELIYAHRGGSNVRLLQENEIAQYSFNYKGYRPMLRSMMNSGVRVLGLENPKVQDFLHQADKEKVPVLCSKEAWQVLSPLGVRERNLYWSKRIEAIYEQDPDALVIVHAGSAHLNYRDSNSLPFMLKKKNPFVVRFSFLNDSKRVIVEQEDGEDGLNFWENFMIHKDQEDASFYVHQVKSKRAAIAEGCDLLIEARNRRIIWPF